MSTARHVAEIDKLRARPFPDGDGGPGFHLALLAESPSLLDADPAEVLRTLEEYAAEVQAVIEVLALRWGDPRVFYGIPGPLLARMGSVPALYGWQVDGRTVALGMTESAPDEPVRLYATMADVTLIG
ncbi:hypothetical protein [Streptomyces sp. GC420]|uniref:hypothetical protein n=1 Tax=Streptomyces sp. GC420 TaxID=2697568 RepID=UPI001414FE6C|nr:hypothetical protein [Streptomyces sp. GC420]NBM14960.1 hypothetical protein [Streptomyces sp. GC420]